MNSIKSLESGDRLCPKCDEESEIALLHSQRGFVYRCRTCLAPGKIPYPLLWFYDSSRMWETVEEPENAHGTHPVKVIICGHLDQFNRIQLDF